MPVNSTGRKYLTDLLKGRDNFSTENFINFEFLTAPVTGSGDVDNIGIPLIWEEATDSFIEFVANLDWVLSTVYAVGDIVKPAVQDGNEYVCTTAGTSDSSEPTFIQTPGSETVDNTVVWTARPAYARDVNSSSTLPNKSRIAVTVGSAFGLGHNKADTTLSVTDANMTVIYRGPAALINEGFIWGSVAAADQAEFLTALEVFGITTADNAEVVTPTFNS